MATIAEILAQAVRHHQVGDAANAEQLYRQILQADPNHADVRHLLGVLAHQRGRFQDAVVGIRLAIQLAPGVAAYYSNLGLAQEELGQIEDAEASYRKALQLQPGFAEAHNNLGKILVRRGKLDDGVEHYRHALSLKPQFPQAHTNLAHVLISQGHLDEAESHCRQALLGYPDFPWAHSCLGDIKLRQGKLAEAASHFRQALHVHPEYPEALFGLGNAFERQDKLDDAIRCFEAAVRLKPSYAEAHNGLGHACQRQHKLDEAVRCFQRVLQLRPDCAEAQYNLGCALLEQGRPDLANVCFDAALRLRPDLAAAQSNFLFCMNYDPKIEPDAIFAAHRRWGRMQPSPGPAPVNDPVPERRLRIGYVSPDLRYHPLARYLEPVLAHHDPQQVEVHCYAEIPKPDDVTCRLKKLAHGWHHTCCLADAEVAERIRRDRIDILVDLAGHTRNGRLAVFAQKPAPVQVSWLGYMNTTGLAAMDYRLTDEVLDPPGLPVRDTERLVRLPGGMCCFAAPADAPPVTPLPAQKRGYLTFGTLSNVFKLNTVVFDLWTKVLEAVPTARLLMFHHTLTETVREYVRWQFTGRGIANDRVELRQGSFDAGYLGVYGDIDVSLDTFPCTGGVTTCESLWMGVPVLTLCGARPASRNSAALLTRVKLNEWIAQSPEQYVALAAQLPRDIDRLLNLRRGLRESMTASVCDAPRFTRALEGAYRNMWRNWCHQGAGSSLKTYSNEGAGSESLI